MSNNEHKTELFLALNPRGKVPVVTVGKDAFYETPAILQYIEAKFPNAKTLIPKDRLAAILTRTAEVSSYVGPLVANDQNYRVRDALAAKKEPEAADIEFLRKGVEAELPRWVAYLKDHEFVAGDGFSLADICFFPLIALLERLGYNLAAKYPQLHAYYDKLKGRPCFKDTWPPHWVGTTNSNPYWAGV